MVILFLITFALEDISQSDEYSRMMHYILKIIEYSCVAFFTFEYILRFLCSPRKMRFLKHPANVIDILAILPFYLDRVLDEMDNVEILGKAGKAMRLTRILRVLRIFKLVRHFVPLQTLLYTLHEAYRELGVLLLLVLLIELSFAVMIYYAEKELPKTSKTIFKTDEDEKWSFVDCLWFCIMTLTTVGDNQKYPSSRFGQLVGGFCAVLGTFFISMPIPIVVNSFARCYKNLVSRNEVSNRRLAIIEESRRQKRMNSAKGRFAKCTHNTMIRTLHLNQTLRENV